MSSYPSINVAVTVVACLLAYQASIALSRYVWRKPWSPMHDPEYVEICYAMWTKRAYLVDKCSGYYPPMLWSEDGVEFLHLGGGDYIDRDGDEHWLDREDMDEFFDRAQREATQQEKADEAWRDHE